MEVNCENLKRSLRKLDEVIKIHDERLSKLIKLEEAYSKDDVIKIINFLEEKLLNSKYTEHIGAYFKSSILVLVSSAFKEDVIDTDFEKYQRKCIALSTLVNNSPDVLRFVKKYFSNKPPPFLNPAKHVPKKKVRNNEVTAVSDLELVKCCYNFLNADTAYFKDVWDWSVFTSNYFGKGCNLQKIYSNHVMAFLSNMNSSQIHSLNENIPEKIHVQFDQEINGKVLLTEATKMVEEDSMLNSIQLNEIHSDESITYIEGVILPVYNKENAKFYSHSDGNYDKFVKVDSTKMNLRSIVLGISSGKAICLSGPVGCGKTTLVEYVARKTGRICPKQLEIEKSSRSKTILREKIIKLDNSRGISKKRTSDENLDEFQNEFCGKQMFKDVENRNGFLRIQLGDQTDSKMLLGQYRCTDVPGEFIWSPGVLTEAVMRGCWLLLEDIDCATQDIYTVLSNLLENNFLNVPGFRDCIKIEPGFQLFATVRTQKSKNSAQKVIFSLLEKYLYKVNVLPLSRQELCQIVSRNYPKLSTIANRIVDVYLTFSSGDHITNDTIRHDETDDSMEEIPNYTSLPFQKVSISSLPNSGRTVSTRDLVKLCQRSDPMFSVTSTECAYFVFQNAVDVFCSYLPKSEEKTKLITSIGAKLGIIQSRCEYFSDEYRPEVQVYDNLIKVGRAQLAGKCLEYVNGNDMDDVPYKKMKLAGNEVKSSSNAIKKPKSNTFSFTRITSCLLEKIAVCIDQNEPVLLVGETGVGKTTSIQYLAEKTQHKLVVVNMNNQSDVSDLVGGYKPVDLKYVMAPLRTDFEILFRKTFNESKNEKFLSNISICFNQNNFVVLIRAMLNIVEIVFQKLRNGDLKGNRCQEYLPKWKELQVKLSKLNSQLKKSINISFAFIPGSLVNCIRNGDWVLLDEINLASVETLECLSTILEPEGSIVLLEKGDFTPVKRHPNFRIFACMNPSTDIGKKDLPVGIRNRFTELFVDELTTENDLVVLVSDYLHNTGIKKVKVFDIVKLYKKLKALSQLELNDGLGNRPVYSLRTLCRALTVCAKNLCGSIERNLYESFCLSFLTQLDPISHKVVLALVTEVMVSNSKAVLSQSIPQPGIDYINFEGYWIKKGPKDILDCLNYILTGSVKENLKDLARIVSIGKLPILLQGPTSAGKTSLIEYVAKKSGNHCLRINNHEHTDLQEYIGAYTSDVSGKLSFKEGVLAQAMRNGYWIILDELNLASTDILEALNRVLDDNRELFIPETQTVIKAHPNFMLFATQNPPGLYGGRKTLSRAFKNRFIELHFSEIPKTELEIILEKRCLIPKSYAQKMVKCMSELQVNRKTTTRSNFTLRDLFRWGNRYTNADKSLLADNLYDWNQHLVDEGYLVLSAKVRTEIEINIIEETLFNHFRKKVFIDKLYTFSENSSMVTRHILVNIQNYKKRTDIIWTQNLIRMAVLTAKALEFNEPVLLVGPTGCGKTTICQILAEISKTDLRILNCHMHTEGADFLGGLRPYRNSENDSNSSKTKLFEWSDGPLVLSMNSGSFFMADEISLAEDSVLERLNSILEPERTLLLAEKGGINNDADSSVLSKVEEEFIIHAREGFQFLATMNPGGDFGKKELSPALRNRFTEIWCKPSDTRNDLIRIATNALNVKLSSKNNDELLAVANVLVDVIFYLKDNIEKFKFSVRDILSWAHYISENSEHINLSLPEAISFGLEIVFLDSLEMLPHESMDNLEKTKKSIFEFTISKIKSILNVDVNRKDLEIKKNGNVHRDSEIFGIDPFFIKICKSNTEKHTKDFLFETPTTKKNLFRLLSALSLKKAILLEGPPGVGKTSIVENLGRAIGYRIVRINLCEHTDLADLFGSDLPVEEKSLEMKPTAIDGTESSKLGTFAWRDGPLLAALKLKNTWILLDELNLAPQSVLEGLNAILDHRGEVFIPELNRTFALGNETRIFACQNPLRQGGGRKGLPQSFLNRFTKVYLKKLTTEDLLFVVNQRYSAFFSDINKYFQNHFNNIVVKTKDTNLFEIMKSSQEFLMISEKQNRTIIDVDLSKRMILFSEILDKGISDFEFGIKGGPFEINLRDLLRWCDLMVNPKTGFVMNNPDATIENNVCKTFENFLLILYERMKLVYYQRMRSSSDKQFVRNAFSRAFNCNAEELNTLSEDIGLYWTDTEIHLNDIMIERDPVSKMFANCSEDQIHYQFLPFLMNYSTPILLSSQRELLQNITECAHMEKVVILCGPTDSGKTKIVNALCTVSNQICNFDTIDDSVTGSFQQIDLNRNLEEVSRNVECIFTLLMQKLTLNIIHTEKLEDVRILTELQSLWKQYNDLTRKKIDNQSTPGISEELLLFNQRMEHINTIINKIISIDEFKVFWIILKDFQTILKGLKNVVQNAESLNTGGHFEWVDSKIVQSLKCGQYICLEHANLCSAAILDRLNSVFEPNGNLLISEKGVMSSTDAEVVEKHKNFRAFLTVDAKNGELSRAMRNRCIEIALNNDCYGTDDLKMMIYESGVKEMNLVNTLLKVHQQIKELSDLSSFSASHLLHFSFLFECYKRIGYDNKRALYDSGMQVYVYPTNSDLLGYGLLYYQQKMRDIVKVESENIEIQEIYWNFENLIPKSNRLNSMAFIRLICEPLIVVLKCYPDIELCNEQLKGMLSYLEDIKSENYFDLLKSIICLLYNTICFADLVKMNEYIRNAINGNLNADNKFIKLINDLNDSLFEIIKNSESKFKEYIQNLPWNTKLYSRIRLYQNYINVDQRNELRLSILLACNIIVEAVEKQDIVKMSKMSALAYSQAVCSKNITDTINNSLLNELHKFLQNFQSYLNSVLPNVDIDIKNFTRMLTCFLWINRLHKCSKGPIYKEKMLNNDLIDKLLLHFKWIRKHILQFIQQLLQNDEICKNDFKISLGKIENYSIKADRPLNLIKKTYFKLVTNFSPLYSEEQIQLYNLRKKYKELMELIPKYGTISNNSLVNKFNMIFGDESQRIKSLLLASKGDFLKYMKVANDSEINVLVSDPALVECLQDFMHTPELNVENIIDLEDVQNSLIKLQETFIKEDDDDYFKEKTHHSVYVGSLMLREYFVAKSLASGTLNENYLEETPSLTIDVLEAIQGLESIEYSKFKKCYRIIRDHIKKLQHFSEMKELLKCIPISIYKNLSTFNRIFTSVVQSYQMSGLSNRRDIYNAYRDDVETLAEVSYNGPPLTDAIFSLIFQCNGELRPIALSELDLWKKSLDHFKQLLWSNSTVASNEHKNCVDDLNTTILESKKLSMEVEYIQELCQDFQNMNYFDYNKNFKTLAEKLVSVQTSAVEALHNTDINLHISARMQQLKFYTSLLHSLRGSLEICLLTFMPLIDPVEKNRLKTEYVNQDISCLNTIMQSYDIMKSVLAYRNFGSEIYHNLEVQVAKFEERKGKLCKKLALRPNVCLYSSLVQEVNHFLVTNCDPKTLLFLLEAAEECWQQLEQVSLTNESLLNIDEVIKRMYLWIANSQKFLHHSLSKYYPYYNDFIKPIECAIVMIKYGLTRLKDVLTQRRTMISILNVTDLHQTINKIGVISETLENITRYPSIKELDIFNRNVTVNGTRGQSTLLSIVNSIEDSNYLRFQLLKVKLSEIRTHISITSEIDELTFSKFDIVLRILNQIWDEEEELKRKKKAEEESLYINKTRCQTETDEEVELREIEENFPTFVNEDFGQYIQQDTLEKVIVPKTKQNSLQNIINENECKLLGKNFVYIMEHFSRLSYYNPPEGKGLLEDLDFLTPFKNRIEIFAKLFGKYKLCLNEWVDEAFYNTCEFAISLQQNNLKDYAISCKNDTENYNFYKDSNIPEIVSCTEILDQIASRVGEQLALYPEHAVLIDIILIIKKIRSLPATSPITRFNTGFQILRQKMSQWNEVAHKNNHLRDLEVTIAENVQNWTKLELQYWRNCLIQTYDKVESSAYKYWFFIYNLIHEYLAERECNTVYSDFNYVEKQFEDGELTDGTGSTSKISILDVINILSQFIEASNYADYFVRMKLLKAFELYLHPLQVDNTTRKESLIAVLHNLYTYFDQFRGELEQTIKTIRTPIEKKLKELVKIESYNKDLSYFSMKNNVGRVHRHLNKFLKEYETFLKSKISKVFQQKENHENEYSLDNDKGVNLRYEPKIKYYMIDVKNFVAPQKLKNLFIHETIETTAPLLRKIDKHFSTSRNVAKQIIARAEFPSLIYSVDMMLTEQIERCDYLRKLEVDRSQEKPKQKSEAKSILQQKRKGLSDLYKSLANLGVNYRTGLMELSLNSELTDYEIEPFCVKSMLKTLSHKKLDQNLIYLNENLDNYYAKCIFKLKLVKNVMLTPNSELGPPNIDRMKGFSIDLFLLVQKQRKMLSKLLKEIYDFRNILSNMTNIFDVSKNCNFSNDQLNFEKAGSILKRFKIYFRNIVYVLEQFSLLLKSAPEKVDNKNIVSTTDEFVISKENGKYHKTVEEVQKILEVSKENLKEIFKLTKCEFISLQQVQKINDSLAAVTAQIIDVKDTFKMSNNSFLPVAKPLLELLEDLQSSNEHDEMLSENDASLDGANIDMEIENIIHSVLLALQNLFKKYSKGSGDKPTENISPNRKATEAEQVIHDNHLRDKIHKELSSDLEVMNISTVIKKLSNIMIVIKYSKLPEKGDYIKKLVSIVPVLEQFNLVADYYLFQQLGAHKVVTKMLYVMLTVFIELGSKGFCIPPDLMQDEDGEQQQKEEKKGEGFGFEDGTGENDVSDKIESEDQLDDAKRPEDNKENENDNKQDCKEEKGIEMSEDFDGKMQDIEKPEDDENNEEDDADEDIDKEMGETDQAAEKLDDQIWGSDEENEESENEENISEEENGKGSKDEDDKHNNLESQNEATEQGSEEQQQEGLDATDEKDKSNKDKKKQQNDIDDMKDPELDEEQTNLYHNELEEPPEAEDMDLGDNCDLDEGNNKDDDNQELDNPFDIDKMKENMEEVDNDDGNEEKEDIDENQNENDANESDSEPEPEAGTKRDEEEGKEVEEIENKDEEEDNLTKKPDEVEKDEEKDPSNEDNEKQEENNIPEDFQESKDKSSKEENVQAMPDDDHKGSDDKVQNDTDKDVKQNEEMDSQDTGEDKEGVGVAENEISDRGHQGVAETKEKQASEQQQKKADSNEKRKQGKTNEERTLGEAEKDKIKRLKTIDKLNEKTNDAPQEEDNEEMDVDAEEYQHIKEPKKNDRITLDGATEDQSKNVQHAEEEEDVVDEEKNNDELMDVDDEEDLENVDNVPDVQPEQMDSKSDKPSKNEKTKEICETTEEVQVEGDITETVTVPRQDDTTAHCVKEILMDTTTAHDLSAIESLELRKMYQDQILGNKAILPHHDDYEEWQLISSKMLPSARELCEQLRLILEPTKCTRLKGDYRTGRRINMKKIIPYIASQFRKDKIWLRRTKPAQRDYKITIAIDDSKSMHHNNSKVLTLQAISLISQALTLLESGKLSILSFGEAPQIILNHTEQFEGPKLVKSLNFDQNQSKIAELLNFIRTANTEGGSGGSDNDLFENLLLILSDGRNIYSEGEQKVKHAVKLARMQRIFLVYIIIDNPENKHSILDIRVPQFSSDKKSLTMKSYLDVFPFPYYVIVRDLNQLPIVLSEAMRQWFELVHSEL